MLIVKRNIVISQISNSLQNPEITDDEPTPTTILNFLEFLDQQITSTTNHVLPIPGVDNAFLFGVSALIVPTSFFLTLNYLGGDTNSITIQLREPKKVEIVKGFNTTQISSFSVLASQELLQNRFSYSFTSGPGTVYRKK